MKSHSRSFLLLRGLGAALALFGALVVPRAARAHIKMSAPADWIMTSSLGDPQKITPCGVDPTMPSTFTVTNAVTTLHVGDKVTFNWTETVPHDGHFRISLAINSRDELKDPAVTKMNSDGTAAAGRDLDGLSGAGRQSVPPHGRLRFGQQGLHVHGDHPQYAVHEVHAAALAVHGQPPARPVVLLSSVR